MPIGLCRDLDLRHWKSNATAIRPPRRNAATRAYDVVPCASASRTTWAGRCWSRRRTTHTVVDRRRVGLVGPGVPTAPVEHEAQDLDLDTAQTLVDAVRDSAKRETSSALDRLAADLPRPVLSLSLRAWPADFPEPLAVRRRPPYSAVADSVMYREVLADAASARGWEVHLFDASAVEAQAARALGARTAEVLDGPRKALGPPWTKDHRRALAATVLAGRAEPPTAS